MKLLVGGYYDDRIFKGETFEGKTPFAKNIDTYTVDEALDLGFIQGFEEYYKEEYPSKDDFDNLTYLEKVELISNYTEGDEIAGLLYFKTEEEALNYKTEVIKEIEKLEINIEYTGKEQDREGYYREVYEEIKGN